MMMMMVNMMIAPVRKKTDLYKKNPAKFSRRENFAPRHISNISYRRMSVELRRQFSGGRRVSSSDGAGLGSAAGAETGLSSASAAATAIAGRSREMALRHDNGQRPNITAVST